MGWNPYPPAGPLNTQPGPSYFAPRPQNPPFYPSYPATPHTDIPSNPPADDRRVKSPIDDDQPTEYPTISDFLAKLAAADRGNHYFDNYTEYFHQHDYFHVDELADESLTTERMAELIPGIKDGTACAIKKKALEKVRRIKGKGKAE